MTKEISQSLKGVAETLLMPLYARAVESRRPDAIIKDKKAEEIIHKLNCDFSRLQLHGHDEIAVLLRMQHFDNKARDFLARNSKATVIHIGCGLDTRFDRVDNGNAQWFDLDLPEVIDLRRKLIGGDGGRYHLLSGSIFDDSWYQAIDRQDRQACLFMAEGVFPYFEEMQIKSLFLKLQDRYPGAELICDAHRPYIIHFDNLQLALSKVDARLHWGLKHGRDIEKWGAGITMLDEWFYFDTNEPRMARYNWMARVPFLGKSTGIFHYRLGSPS
jgi:O-methyltransferase involved in polyketide biosynthesis